MTIMATHCPTPTPTPAAIDWHQGSLMTWHVTGEQSAGAMTFGEVVVRQGCEPPLHVHAREDETWYVLDGVVLFQRGTDRLLASPGDAVWLPRGIPHGFAVISPTARLLHAYTPGGLDAAFREVSVPAPAPVLPDPPVGPPDAAAAARITSIYAAHGVTFVGPPLSALLAEEGRQEHTDAAVLV